MPTEAPPSPRDMLDARAFAELMGVKPKTIHNRNSEARLQDYPEGEGKFPKPTRIKNIKISDTYTIQHPVWQRSVVEKYIATRPGPGWWAKDRIGREDQYRGGKRGQ